MRKSHYTQIGKEMEWHPLEQGVFGDARKIKIAVVGIGREAGASFVAANLAYHLAKHVDGVTYMEAEDAQIAETLEGRRSACYSLGLSDALGFADPLGRNREPGRKRKRDCLPEPDRKRKRDRDCDRALGLDHPIESARDQTHTADRNRESARPRDHDRQPASEWSAECDRLPERDCDRVLGFDYPIEPGRDQTHTLGRNREPNEKFTDYFALEKEGLPAGSRRNLYANVNWAVRAPLGAAIRRTAPFEAAPAETSSFSETRSEPKLYARSQTPPAGALIRRTVPLKTAPAETSTLETVPPSASPIAWQAGQDRAHAPLSSTVSGVPRGTRSYVPLDAISSDARQGTRPHVPLSEAPTDAQQGAPLRQPRLRPAASEPCMLAETQGIGRIPGRYMIVDNPRPESLWEADLVICVVDPLPSRLRSEIRQLEALRDNQICFGRRFSPLLNLPSPVLWVLNKDNPQAGHRELERSLNIKFDFAVPLLSLEIFYKAEYSSVPIFQMVEAAVRPHPSGSSDKQRTRTHPLAPQGADGCGGSPRSYCDTGACSEFDRLARRILKLLD